MNKEPLRVIKVGGKVVETHELLDELIRSFASLNGAKVLVHGGGRTATAMATRLGVPTEMVGGRRITDAEMLRIVTMVYGGLVNKSVVAALQAAGVDALGLTGADMDVIRAHRRPPIDGVDFGFVGDIDRVDAAALTTLIETGVTPVIAPLTHDGAGHLLNTNADTIASTVAQALSANYDVTLTYCFEHAGVLTDPNDEESVIPLITADNYHALKEEEVITGGMIPKIDNALAAVAAGVKRVIITRADALNEGCGTTIA